MLQHVSLCSPLKIIRCHNEKLCKKNAHKGKTAYRTPSVFRYNKILKDVRMNKHPKKQKKNK